VVCLRGRQRTPAFVVDQLRTLGLAPKKPVFSVGNVEQLRPLASQATQQVQDRLRRLSLPAVRIEPRHHSVTSNLAFSPRREGDDDCVLRTYVVAQQPRYRESVQVGHVDIDKCYLRYACGDSGQGVASAQDELRVVVTGQQEEHENCFRHLGIVVDDEYYWRSGRRPKRPRSPTCSRK